MEKEKTEAGPEPTNMVPNDIAVWLGLALLEPQSITEAIMKAKVKEAKLSMKRRVLAEELRNISKACLVDCGLVTRSRLRDVLDRFDELEKKG